MTRTPQLHSAWGDFQEPKRRATSSYVFEPFSKGKIAGEVLQPYELASGKTDNINEIAASVLEGKYQFGKSPPVICW